VRRGTRLRGGDRNYPRSDREPKRRTMQTPFYRSLTVTFNVCSRVHGLSSLDAMSRSNVIRPINDDEVKTEVATDTYISVLSELECDKQIPLYPFDLA
jgi:hypothetical protein